ncbi:MAG: hypothetical protein PCFJNLEI_00617 [Verrucomicrobiae bacterium]|nr:hypothetical protein [Verrucomicrobiae bacterium]
MMILLVCLAAVIGLAILSYRTSRAGYESAPYTVVRTDGKFELRDYPTLTVVETPMMRGGNSADNGFMRLFRFITGQNEAKQKIAMTTPVFMSACDSNQTMAFVMPASMTASQVPKPADGALTVREQEPGRFAVLRFSGWRNAQNESESLERLSAWTTAQGLKVVSSPIYGYFDPPWTLPFLRRNEVMLRMENR